MIELQLIKPVTPGTPGAKGKISLKNLFKEYLDLLQVPNYDPCCDEVAPACPPISADVGNIIECREDGLFAEAGGEAFITAQNGLNSPSEGIVELGGELITETALELNGNNFRINDGAGNDIVHTPGGTTEYYNASNLIASVTPDEDELVTTGNTRTTGWILGQIKVDADQADYVIQPEDSGTVFIKFFDGNVIDRNLTLPPATVGLIYSFGYSGNGTVFVRVVPQVGEGIFFGDPSANPGFSTTGIEANNNGCTITLYCPVAGEWHPLSQMGIWAAV